MKLNSLRFRLLVAAFFSVILALLLANQGLLNLFEAQVERRLDSELKSHVRQLIGGIEKNEHGQIELTVELADPRFNEPFSGLYWQIQDETRHHLLRSRSLWDQVLPLPPDEISVGEIHHHQLPGPQQQTLMVEERQIILQRDTQPQRLRIAVALDRADILTARQKFAADIWPYLTLLAGFLLLASTLQVFIGLAPMAKVRQGVTAIRSGDKQRLSGHFPSEIKPLVDEINELLAAAEDSIEKARAWTGDLAHGLKTPLTALSTDAQRLRQQGHEQLADDMQQLIETMRSRLDRELMRARLRSRAVSIAHGHTERADLAKAVYGVQNTLHRSPKGTQLQWQINLPDSLPELAMHQSDLTELIGNLMENASKWAATTVQVSYQGNKPATLYIEDDGPGVKVSQRIKLGQRGLRLDESITGHGLGLAIVRDICDVYGIGLKFDESSLGGLAVQLSLPK